MAKYTVYTAEYEPQTFMREFCERFGDMVVTIEVIDPLDSSLVTDDDDYNIGSQHPHMQDD